MASILPGTGNRGEVARDGTPAGDLFLPRPQSRKLHALFPYYPHGGNA